MDKIIKDQQTVITDQEKLIDVLKLSTRKLVHKLRDQDKEMELIRLELVDERRQRKEMRRERNLALTACMDAEDEAMMTLAKLCILEKRYEEILNGRRLATSEGSDIMSDEDDGEEED